MGRRKGKKKSFASGKGRFFGITSSSELVMNEVEGDRVSPQEISEKIPGCALSGPIFIESRNQSDKNKKYQSLVIAFQRKSLPNIWKLGFIHSVDDISQTMNILVWNGPTTTIDAKLYPSFFFNSYEELTSSIAFEGTTKFLWEFHFTKLSLNMDRFVEFHYLNQVNGRLPRIWTGTENSESNLINHLDGCFEQSSFGGDLWRIPNITEQEFRPIEKRSRPFFLPNSALEFLPHNFSKSKRKRSRGRKSKVSRFLLEPEIKTLDHLEVQTIFVRDVLERNLKGIANEDCFYVPYPSDYIQNMENSKGNQRFAVVKNSKF